jgi:surfactin synthase thioesterase subunit/acyl-CoA synthetase (AMP-forming)/AMP-acid ligase II/acyl carrier protein
LYCFPHAGGSPSSFRDWQHHLQRQRTGLKVAVRVLSLPGRGGRFQETPWDDWDLPGGSEEGGENSNGGYRGKFVTALTQAFLTDWDGMTPYAFFGHSFGTLLTYELILQLRRLDIRPLPLLNVVSAHRAPGISPELCGIPQTHALPRSEFVDMIRTWGLVPEEALDDDELVDVMLPALRADLRLDETHKPPLLSVVESARQSNSAEAAPSFLSVPVPMVLYGGIQDQTVPSHQLLAWKEIGPAEATEVVWFEGDHFYTVSHLTKVMKDLSRRLRSALRGVDRSILVGGMRGRSQSQEATLNPDESGDHCLIEDGYDVTNDTSNIGDGDLCPTVLDLFFDQVRRTPNFLAMIDETGKEWTYTALQAAVIALGKHLIRVNRTADSIKYDASESDTTVTMGQPPRVGIFLHHASSYLVANLSSWYAGCSVVLLERNWTGALLREFIEVCKVDVVVTDDKGTFTLMEAGVSSNSFDAPKSFANKYEAAEEEEKKDALPEEEAATSAGKRPSPRILIFPPGGAEELEVSLGSSTVHGRIAMDPDDVAFVSMTSGSTGKPSAVLTTHRGTTFCFEGRYELYPYRSTANDIQEREGANVFFAWESIRPLLRGHVVVIIPDEAILSPPHFVNFLHRNKVTRLVVTPSLLESVFTYPHLGETLAAKLDHMYGWFLMGEVVPMRLIERAEEFLPSGVRLVNAYSSWEALDVSYSDLLPLKHCQIKLGDSNYGNGRRSDSAGDIQSVDKTPIYAPVGWPLPKVHALLLDENSMPVPRGVPGTLHVLTPALALGYLDDPVKTSARFRQVPSQVYEALLRVHPDLKPSQLGLGEGQGALLFNSGDMGRILPDGQLALLGRGDDTVKIRGYKVGIPFVESTLNGIQGVATAVVLPILDDATQQPDFLAAYLVGHEGKPSETTLEAIAQTARELLPPYAVPRDFIGIEALPLREGESRKLDKKALPEPPGLIKKREVMKRSSEAHDGEVKEKKDTDSRRSEFVSKPSPNKPSKRIQQIISQVWAETLHLDDDSFFDQRDNFFDIGGNSLLASELIGRLSSQYGLPLSVLDLYQHSSLGALVQYCQNLTEKKTPSVKTSVSSLRHRRRKFRSSAQYSGKIAIVGMSGKFPGASNLHEFWKNIQAGRDSLRTFTKAELAAQGLPSNVYNNPNWVPVGQVLDDADKFDAAFWDISPREARTMDPQHRVFLEVAWSALEDAGYPPQSSADGPRTGVWAACGIDGYLVHHLQGGGLTTPLDPTNLFLTEVGNEKDYISTRVSYALDLGGPSMAVTSACSSGLVAVAQAAQSLMVGQTDVAVAGASSLTFPNMGYRYEKGMVGSTDGHVRPFDEDASGTLFGDGVGAVVLKR